MLFAAAAAAAAVFDVLIPKECEETARLQKSFSNFNSELSRQTMAHIAK